MMVREYSFSATPTRLPTYRIVGFVRVVGEMLPGEEIVTQIRIPNGPTDWIPDNLNGWSREQRYVIGLDGRLFIDTETPKGGLALTFWQTEGSVRLHAEGEGWIKRLGIRLESPVVARAVLVKQYDRPEPETPVIVIPDPVIEPPADTGEPIDVSKVVWQVRSAKGYRIASGLKADISSRGINFYMDNPLRGDVWAFGINMRDGVYYGGTFDGLGEDASPREFKSLNNLRGGKNGEKGGPLWARGGPKRTEAESRRYLQLKRGERFWVGALATKTRTRTKVVELIYP